MKPMATAYHSGSHGSGLSRSSRRITRHRIKRIGNVNVASATVSTRRRGSTARRPASTSLHCVPRTAHAKNATVTARPRIQAQREGEGEEIGRASCRERVEIGVGGGAVKKEKKSETTTRGRRE